MSVTVYNRAHPIVSKLPLLQSYSPSKLVPKEYGQTIWGTAFRSFISLPQMEREVVETPDGGEVCLDWSSKPENITKLLVLIPGVTGSIESKYIRFMCRDARANGWDTVVLTFRGLFGQQLRNPRFTCGADRDDVVTLFQRVVERTTQPDCFRVIAGVSMGANILVNFLANPQHASLHSHLRGAMSISNPFHFPASAARLHSTFIGRRVAGSIATTLKQTLRQNLALAHKLEAEARAKENEVEKDGVNGNGDQGGANGNETPRELTATPRGAESSGANGNGNGNGNENDNQQKELRFPNNLLWFPEEESKMPTRQLPMDTPLRANIPLALMASTVAEFDHAYTAPALGYNSLLHYYHSASSAPSLIALGNAADSTTTNHNINNPNDDTIPRNAELKFPLLVVSSLDDPFVAERPFFPYAAATAHPKSNVVIADCVVGGHVGFLESVAPSASSWVERLCVQFACALFEAQGSLQHHSSAL